MMGDLENPWMEEFLRAAGQKGFDANVVKHETDTYTLPIFLLEGKK